jgi:excisionase family DNA binding protein
MAGLLGELAREAQELAQELQDCLAACAKQSDVMDVPEAQELSAKHLVRSLLSVEDLASQLAVSPSTIRRWRRAKLLPEGVVLGGLVRWRPDAIDAWLQEQDR